MTYEALCTHNLLGGEIKEPRAEDGGREEAQEYEAGHDGVAHLRVGGEVARRALPQRVEQPAHGRRARAVWHSDRREHLRAKHFFIMYTILNRNNNLKLHYKNKRFVFCMNVCKNYWSD